MVALKVSSHTQHDQADTTEQGERFHITDDDGANWYLKKIGNLQAERERVQAQAAEMLKQIDSDIERLKYLYEGEMKAYALKKIEANGGMRKSVTFLQGTAGFRTVPASLKIADGKEALEYAESEYPAAIRTLQTLDLTTYRERAEWTYKATGELLPGVDVVPEHESFSVKFGKVE